LDSNAQRFRQDGYVILHGLFEPDRIRRLRNAVERVRELVDHSPDAHKTRYTMRAGSEVDTWGVDHIFGPGLYQEEFGDVLENERIIAFVQEVLGDERLRFWRAHLYWEPRRVDYALHWHRDYGELDHYDPDGRATHAHVNVCLWDDTSLRIVPGTHRRALTADEDRHQRSKSTSPLAHEQVIRCRAGDTLVFNAHLLHRGACAAGTRRGTVHVELQAYREPTGGHGSWRYLREPGYLERLRPTARELMRNAIEWDDAHPLSMSELLRGRRLSRDIEQHEARRQM
jgi:ectoine hydroxylase-related dioxygenase (phytanoyl-CoA dioxygenase family)